MAALWTEVPKDLLYNGATLHFFLLILFPASWFHAVSVVGNGPLEVSKVGLEASCPM